MADLKGPKTKETRALFRVVSLHLLWSGWSFTGLRRFRRTAQPPRNWMRNFVSRPGRTVAILYRLCFQSVLDAKKAECFVAAVRMARGRGIHQLRAPPLIIPTAATEHPGPGSQKSVRVAGRECEPGAIPCPCRSREFSQITLRSRTFRCLGQTFFPEMDPLPQEAPAGWLRFVGSDRSRPLRFKHLRLRGQNRSHHTSREEKNPKPNRQIRKNPKLATSWSQWQHPKKCSCPHVPPLGFRL